VLRVRLACAAKGLGSINQCRAITTGRMRDIAVQFDQLGVIDIRTEASFNRFKIGAMSVAGDLNATWQAFVRDRRRIRSQSRCSNRQRAMTERVWYRRTTQRMSRYRPLPREPLLRTAPCVASRSRTLKSRRVGATYTAGSATLGPGNRNRPFQRQSEAS
jgi:hypothetical protein